MIYAIGTDVGVWWLPPRYFPPSLAFVFVYVVFAFSSLAVLLCLLFWMARSSSARLLSFLGLILVGLGAVPVRGLQVQVRGGDIYMRRSFTESSDSVGGNSDHIMFDSLIGDKGSRYVAFHTVHALKR